MAFDDELDARIKARLAQIPDRITEADDTDYRNALDAAHKHGRLGPTRTRLQLAQQQAEDALAAERASKASGLDLTAVDPNAPTPHRVRNLPRAISAPLNDGDVETAQSDVVPLRGERVKMPRQTGVAGHVADALQLASIPFAHPAETVGALANMAVVEPVTAAALATMGFSNRMNARTDEERALADQVLAEPEMRNAGIATTAMAAAGPIGELAGEGAFTGARKLLGRFAPETAEKYPLVVERALGGTAQHATEGAVVGAGFDHENRARGAVVGGALGVVANELRGVKRGLPGAPPSRLPEPRLLESGPDRGTRVRPDYPPEPDYAVESVTHEPAGQASGQAIVPRPAGAQDPTFPGDPVVRPNVPAAPSLAAQAVRAQMDDLARASRPAPSQVPRTGFTAPTPPAAPGAFPIEADSERPSPESLAAAEVTPERWDASSPTGLAEESPAYGDDAITEGAPKFGQSPADSPAYVALYKSVYGVEPPPETRAGAAPSAHPDVVGSDAFKQWFGKSQLVDENGLPRTLFHGTRNNFDEFRYGDVGFHVGDPLAAGDIIGMPPDKGLVDDPNMRKLAGGQNVMPVHVRLENPVQLSGDPGSWTGARFIHQLQQDKIITPREAYDLERQLDDFVEADAPMTPEESQKLLDGALSGDTSLILGSSDKSYRKAAPIRELLEKKGYDGIAYPNIHEGVRSGKPSTSYIAFRPQQIKSAIGNRGTFDSQDPKIIHDESPDYGEVSQPRRGILTSDDRIDLQAKEQRLAELTTQRRALLAQANDARLPYETRERMWSDIGKVGDELSTLQQEVGFINHGYSRAELARYEAMPDHELLQEQVKHNTAQRPAEAWDDDHWNDRQRARSAQLSHISTNRRNARPETAIANKMYAKADSFTARAIDLRESADSGSVSDEVGQTYHRLMSAATALTDAGMAVEAGQVLDPGTQQLVDKLLAYEFADDRSAQLGKRQDLLADESPAYGDETPVVDPAFSPVADVANIREAFRVASSRQFGTGRELKLHLQSAVQDAAREAGVDLTKRTEAVRRYLTGMAVADTRTALENSKVNGVGWYDLTTRKALSILSLIHPEIAADDDAHFAFVYALAVTSNGLKVDKNFPLADTAYRQYKQTGKMPLRIGIGTAAPAINNSMALFNRLSADLGLPALRELMTTRMTVRELNARMKSYGIKVSGELQDASVLGAAILGPKIGNGFFGNLYGHFDQLTMDRWFMRTWGRWTGTLVVPRPDQVTLKSGELASAVATLRTDPVSRKRLEEILGTRITAPPRSRAARDAWGVETARAIAKATMVPQNRTVMNRLVVDGTKVGATIRKTGNALAKWADGQKEAPSGGAERAFIRSVIAPSLAALRGDYPALTTSDLQAVLWYPEKLLYDTARAKQNGAVSQYDESAAPDYANAAADLARAQGVSQEDIDHAVATEVQRGGVPAAERAGGAQRSAGGDAVQPTALADESPEYGVDRPDGALGDGGAGRDADARPYTSRSPDAAGPRRILGREVATVATHEPTPEWARALAASGHRAPVMHELDARDMASVDTFVTAITAAKTGNPFGASVYIYPASDYAGMRLFLSPSGKTGVALKGVDMVSGFSIEKGGRAAVALAIAEGGRTNDCFDTVLPAIYADLGMRVVSRIPWNDAEAPADWSKATFRKFNGGEPDVVFMVHDPAFTGDRLAGERAASYDEAVQMQQDALRQATLHPTAPDQVMDETPSYDATPAPSPAPSPEPVPAPAFYSRLERAITSFPSSRGTVEQWAAHLARDVNRDEVEWTGFADALAPALEHTHAQQAVQDAQGALKRAITAHAKGEPLSYPELTVSAAEATLDRAKAEAKEVATRTAEFRHMVLSKAELTKLFDRNKIELELIELGNAQHDPADIRAADENLARLQAEFRENLKQLNEYVVPGMPNHVLAVLAQHGIFDPASGSIPEEGMALLRERQRLNGEIMAAHDAVDRFRRKPDGAAKYKAYTLPGGDDYHETLIRLKPRESPERAAYEAAYEREKQARRALVPEVDPEHDGPEYDDDPEILAKKRDTFLRAQEETQQARDAWVEAGSPDLYPHGSTQTNKHWTEHDNVLAHFRFTTRDVNGERVLHVEEVQSDWHQLGRKQGYNTPAAKRALEAAQADYDKAYEAYLAYRAKGMQEQLRTEPEERRLSAAMKKARETLQDLQVAGRERAKDAPFKATEDWAMLVAKHVIDRAVKGGYDRVAWTSGDLHGDRYDLSKHADGMTYYPDTGRLVITMRKVVLHDDIHKPHELGEVIGDALADRLLAKDPVVIGPERNNERAQQILGEEIKVPAMGMRAFYDRMLPKALKQYGKKMGVAIDPVMAPIVDREERWVATAETGVTRAGEEPTADDLRELAEHAQQSNNNHMSTILDDLADTMDARGGKTFSEAVRGLNGWARDEVLDYVRTEDAPSGKIALPSFPITPALKDLVNSKGQFLMDEPHAQPAPPRAEERPSRAYLDALRNNAAVTAFGSVMKMRRVELAVKNALRKIAAAKLPSAKTRLAEVKAHESLPIVDLRGTVLSDPYAAAEAMTTQRSPLMEHMSVMHLGPMPGGELGLGTVVLHTRETNGALNFATFDEATLDRIVADAKRVGTNAVLLAHNHPSGLAVPSSADIQITVAAADYLARHGIAVMGHIVIDHDEFGWINHDGSHVPRVGFDRMTPAKYRTAVIDNRPSLVSPQASAALVKSISDPDALSVVLLDTQFSVVAATARPKDDIGTIGEWLQDLMQKTGAQKVMFGTDHDGMARLTRDIRSTRAAALPSGDWTDDVLDLFVVHPDGDAKSLREVGGFEYTGGNMRSSDLPKYGKTTRHIGESDPNHRVAQRAVIRKTVGP